MHQHHRDGGRAGEFLEELGLARHRIPGECKAAFREADPSRSRPTVPPSAKSTAVSSAAGGRPAAVRSSVPGLMRRPAPAPGR